MKFVLPFLCTLIFFSSAIAQGNERWADERERLVTAKDAQGTDEENCQKFWEAIWLWAKKGDLEARADLFWSLMPPPHADAMVLPGYSTDTTTRIRNAMIVAVHSLGVEKEAKKIYPAYEQIDDVIISSKFFEGNHEFSECLSQKASKECTEVAMKENLIPSFENFASEIDLFVAQGMKPKCFQDRALKN